ncbi:AraC family transcriptional regulator [Chryseobacterium arthrosphaerae]|uniref:helix-turn-helix domain-containing protein n=1 Tax=Chryseobacterium arthrosphaerae TaxID=651561 RepID=UPI000F502C40|nr:AraC family transcriptional regulator [Chryseobacterium arthrosphaerae]AYZ12770.1 AraC family transcriptional regulator [Chryseobacterium arthrosphaerae]
MNKRFLYILFIYFIFFSSVYSQESLFTQLAPILNKERALGPDKAFMLANRIEDTTRSSYIKAYIFDYKGNVYTDIDDLKNSIIYKRKAQELYEKNNDFFRMAKCQGAIGERYSIQGLYEKANEQYNLTIETTKRVQDKSKRDLLLTTIMTAIADIKYEQKHFKESIIEYKKAMNMTLQLKPDSVQQFPIMIINMGLANNYKDLSQFELSEKHYNKMIYLAKKLKSDVNIIEGLGQKAILYNKMGKYQNAIHLCDSIFQIPFTKNSIEVKKNVYEVLSNAYLGLNDAVNAKKYKELYDKSKTETDKLKKASINESINQIVNTKSTQVKENERKSSTRIIMILISFCIIISSLIYVFQRKKRIKEKKAFDQFVLIYKEREKAHEKSIVRKEIVREQSSNTKQKYEGGITESKENKILKALQLFEKQKGYLDPNLSLSVLSATLNTNNSYLSEVINKHHGKNFNAYINELRIFYIIDKLNNNSKYRNYKISSLAEESGFISHSAFTIVFKKVTGTSPSFYIKNIQ